MTRRVLFAAPLALALALGACNDLLTEQPDSFLTTDSFFKSAADVDAAVLSVYRRVNSNNCFILELASDQSRHNVDEPTPLIISPDYLDWTAASNGPNGTWTGFFDLVFHANLVLDHAPGMAIAEGLKAPAIAEAKFLRGLGYLRLVQHYGDVPLLLSEADHAKPGITRTPAAQVLAQVEKDLTEAEAALPATRPANQWGRARKAAAQMALAELYLWRSSARGASEWQQASDWSKKVVDATTTYGLNDNYFSTFLPSNKGNKEMILTVTSSGVDARSSIGVVNNFYPRDLPFSAGGGFSLINVTQWFVNSYAAGDFRGAVGPTGPTVGYRTTVCTPDNSRCVNIKDSPSIWKFRPTSANSGLGDVEFPIYRYAEALLMYAEAQNELGNTATAIQYVNMVRARARKGTGSESRTQPADLPTTLTKEQARDAIYMERAWELAFEQKRWFDLVRRDGVEPGYFVAQLQAHDPHASQRGRLSNTRKLFPVPQTEIDAMSTLSQNPGY